MAESAASEDTGHKPELLLIFIISKYLSIIISSALGLWQYLQMDHVPQTFLLLLRVDILLLLLSVWHPELTSSIGKLRARPGAWAAWAAWPGWIGGRRGLSGTNYSDSEPRSFLSRGRDGGLCPVFRRIKLSVARWRLRVMNHHLPLWPEGRLECHHYKSRWKYTPRQPFGVS